ncbi:MAG: alpha/beta fold hydrolase [Nitrospirota bacterium]|nr:alpha/beta fold hydrolase [Nitrospirota bacterium]MDH5773629.1 alpha/beta fold hydrolase [Nitrospirota bacterium]
MPHPSSVELIQRVPFQTIQINHHRIAYLEAGQGKPVILIHGFGGSMWQWEYQYLPLAQSHRVIIPDLIGSGLSDKPETSYSPEQLVQFFLDFMDSLEITRATLIGNSMGAGLAMALALDYPDRVDQLILISGFPPQIEPSVASPQYRRFLYHRPPLWLATLGNHLAGRRTTERFLKEIVYKPELISDTVIERSFQNRQRGGLLSPLYSLLDHIDIWDNHYGYRLGTIPHPTLLLWGDHDRIFPLEVGKQLHRLLPHAEWHIIAESGHLPQWERPQEVNPLILSFLGKP